MMSVKEWKKVPAEKRKVLGDAAKNLRLSISELREKLLIVAAIESDEDPTYSEQVVIHEVVEDERIQPAASSEDVSKDAASLLLEATSLGGAGSSSRAQGTNTAAVMKETRNELMWWKEKDISKSMIEVLESG